MANAPMSPAVTELHALSWNLFGSPVAPDSEARMRRVAAEAASAVTPYDLLLFQEVWTEAQSQAITELLADQFQVEPCAPARGLLGRKGGLLAAIRKTSPWQCATADFHEFDNEASDFFFWQGDGIADKGVQRLKLTHRDLELQIQVFNTHLQSDYAPRRLFTFDAVRAGQLRELEALARAAPDVPALAFGDFNLGPTSPNYRQLIAYWTKDLSRTTREACDCDTHDGAVGGAADWIDYALARPTALWAIDGKVTRLERCDAAGMLSDHNGLEARIQFRRKVTASLGALAAATLAGPTTRRTWITAAGALIARAITGGFIR